MVAMIIAATMLYGPYLWCRVCREPLENFGLHWTLSRKALAETLIIATLTLIPLTAVALHWPGVTLPHILTLKESLLRLTAGVVASIVEETFFRGWLQTLLSRHLRSVTAIIATSALFALSHRIAHPEPIFLATFFPGLVMGLLRQRHGSVAPAALYHSLGNLWAVWFFPLP